MNPAQNLVLSVANDLQRRAFAAMSAAAPGARRRMRRHAFAPGGFDDDFHAVFTILQHEFGAPGAHLASFLRRRRFLPDAPPPRASRLVAAPWLLALAHELPHTWGLAAALGGPEDAWRAYVAPLDRARDMRLQIGVAAALTNMLPRLPDARPGPRAF